MVLREKCKCRCKSVQDCVGYCCTCQDFELVHTLRSLRHCSRNNSFLLAHFLCSCVVVL